MERIRGQQAITLAKIADYFHDSEAGFNCYRTIEAPAASCGLLAAPFSPVILYPVIDLCSSEGRLFTRRGFTYFSQDDN